MFAVQMVQASLSGEDGLSASAMRDEVEYIAVILHGDTSQQRFDDARTLLDYAFANYTLITPRAEVLPAVEVTLGTEESVPVVCGESGRVLVEKALQGSLEPTVELAEAVEAPVAVGQRLGTLTLSANGRTVAEVPLLAAGSVERLGFLQIWTRLVRTLCGQG